MKIKILPKKASLSAAKLARKVAQVLLGFGAKLIAEEEFAAVFSGLAVSIMPAQAAYKSCDIVITVGGDGTLLHAAGHIMRCPKLLMGINSGRLGFLTTIEENELSELRRLFEQDYIVENRSLLKACGFANGKPFEKTALNDIVICKEQGNTISLDIFCDETKVNSFCGDGVIFATPTGSTAYSLSAGGPVLDTKLGGIVMTQICPHIYFTPPMVFSPQRKLKVVPSANRSETALLTCDGGGVKKLDSKSEIFILQSEKTIPMLQFSNAQQMESIDKKMKWR